MSTMTDTHRELLNRLRQARRADPHGGWVHGSNLSGIAGIRYGARIGELRDEGWIISKSKAGCSGGWHRYRLESLTRGPRRQRRISFDLTRDEIAALSRGEVPDSVRQQAAHIVPPQVGLFGGAK